MGTLHGALRSVLAADAELAAAVGDRIFPVGTRENAGFPQIVYQRISTASNPHLDGPSNLDSPRYQLDTYAKMTGSGGADSAVTIAERVRELIDCTSSTGDGFTFYATFQDERHLPDEETKLFRVSQDYFLWHER